MNISVNDLREVTFAFALIAPNNEQIANMHAMVSFIKREFSSPIVVIESGDNQKFYSQEVLGYRFEQNTDSGNFTLRLLEMAKTKLVSVTKENFLFDRAAFVEAYQHLLSSEDIIAVPYDRRIAQVNYSTTNYFRSALDYPTFVELVKNKHLNYFRTFSFASIYIADRVKFLAFFQDHTEYLDLDHSPEFIARKLEFSGNHIHYGAEPLYLLFQNDNKVDDPYEPALVNALLDEYKKTSSFL